ncbi:MAG: tail fiber domain-containing protein, partial [Candidatus Thorarchaeota archaeon]
MPLNKLENFIKNTEGRILYVNPSDLDATDAIENQGNSLTKPFKTIQRALLEAARFSYLRGSDNDIVEKTTILLFPGEHLVDNRPGFAIKDVSGTATAVSPAGAETVASTTLTLTTSSVFDLTQEDNILYKFNSIHGGVIVPRGTSIVGLDLRKTKLRPKYVPNPTDSNLSGSALLRVTGACYFWQFSIFDGDQSGLVYTDSSNFGSGNQSKPTFSHHKLTCFEYADGVNIPTGYTITDLDMYYSKLSNAFNTETGRNIDQKWPGDPQGFAKKRSEWEIVGAFAADPVNISTIKSGDGFTPGSVITVTTSTAHGLTTGTPIKIKGVSVDDYNVSTTVQSVSSTTEFTFLLPFVRNNLTASPSASGATVTIETDTVQGASPYIFNISLRSVWGMNGMHADGSKAAGFRSMVVAQFTAVSLQKDDRAFVKYNESSRVYEGITISKVTGSALSNGSSSTESDKVYHLDSDARYRIGWETSHIKGSNDCFIQVVSVFAIGFSYHFDGRSGGDFSITNSNSNFGQISLNSEGFKKEAFSKDNKGYITSVITPKAITTAEESIDWVQLDVGLTTSVGISSHLYLYGYTDKNIKPPILVQGYRVGAKKNDTLSVVGSGTTYSANIFMVDNVISTTGITSALGTSSAVKEYEVSGVSSNILTTAATHKLQTGEEVIIISDSGDLPENIEAHRSYYIIRESGTQVKLASSLTNAENDSPITIYGGTNLKILSRVSEKGAGEVGSPVQFDAGNGNWYIHSANNNAIYNAFNTLGTGTLGSASEPAFFKRTEDPRSLDEKLYKFRVVVPKDLDNAKDPEEGFVIQESSSTSVRSNADFTATGITTSDYDFNRNPRFISTCSTSASTVTVITELPHDVRVGEKIIVKNVTSTGNTAGTLNKGYNGVFTVASVVNDKTFTHSTTDIDGVTHSTGSFTNNTSSRTTALPRFERNDWQDNYYIYRNEVIKPYIKDVQDGVYHLYVLNAGNAIQTEYTDHEFSQNVADLYPQLDRDNIDANPFSAKSYAKRTPVGQVVTNDLKKSLTRETVDGLLPALGIGLTISGVTTSFPTPTTGVATVTFYREHNLSGIVTYSTLTGGTGYTNGTYHNVKLFNDGTSTWDGATATVTVSGGAISAVDITAGGSGYVNGEDLDFDTSRVGGGTGGGISIATAGISTVIGNTVQITGIGTTASGHYRITGVPAKNQVAIAITNKDPRVVQGQYLLNVGSELTISSSVFTSATGITTFTMAEPHGLVVGNNFTVKNIDDDNMGDYLITGITTTTVSAKTSVSLTSPKYLLKHGLSANDKTSDVDGENLGARGFHFYGNETAILQSNITNETSLHVQTTNSGISTTNRFELGSYIQVDDEIMRITTSTLSGSGNNEISVIRGALGTLKQNHSGGALIKKITPKAIEFRRPSYLRSSGHTFEYIGYGPGNYSTALPQVQVKTLSDKEDYLAQAQEKNCGIVVYTGMNSVGDFFIGNKKINSSTGQEEVFDIPVPTVTGEDPSSLSVVFDEVIVKQRLVVEGGNSGTVLSQFDGPVTFNKELKMNDPVTINGTTKLTSTFESTNTTDNTLGNVDTGAVQIDGGVGIAKNVTVGAGLSVGQGLTVAGVSTFVGLSTFQSDLYSGGVLRVSDTTQNTLGTTNSGSFQVLGGAGIAKNLTVGGATTITGNVHIKGNITVEGTGLFPIGSIIIWYGAVANIPSGWSLCNGATVSGVTTPDLRERFVV